jgi:hypothetical protein
MEYNSQREELTIPEYGRHVQKLIQYAKTISDDRERQAVAEQIVQLMMQMNPQSKTMEDYRDKLWRHLFRIADYDIKVVPPNGDVPSAEERFKKPEQLKYPETEAQYRHYGHNVQQLIKKCLDMEPGPKREAFKNVIASYMKLAYKTWNKDYYVSDDVIKADLKTLSNGELTIEEEATIDNLGGGQQPQQGKQRRSSKQRSNGNGGRRGRGGRRRKN